MSPLTIEEDDPQFVEREIHALEGTRFHWLHFRPALEEQFEAATVAVRTSRMLVNGVVSILFFNLFLISDYQLRQVSFSHFVFIRLFVATPPAIAGALLLWIGVSKRVRESIIVVVCSILAMSVLYLYAGESAVVSAYVLTHLIILVLFTNVGFHIRLEYAVCTCIICLALGGMFLWNDALLSAPQKFEGGCILLVGIILSLVANYSMERAERLNFLLRLRSDQRAGKLASSNEHLRRISNEDRLTQLPNRRHFDNLYKLAWQEGVKAKTPISVVMIDIDNFKELNDRYGHLYGDAVLSRVAALLPPALRVKGDFVARYGGEEFIVVLPNTAQDAALRVAERMRQLVELAGSPPPTNEASRDHGWSTVSCGVATMIPRRGVEPSSLIEAADKALYRAKAGGRNRVCT